MVSGKEHKIDALTRILEAESFDGVLVFVRTRIMTVELAEKLEARGYASAAAWTRRTFWMVRSAP